MPALEVSGLRCEYRVDPQGIDAVVPRLEWRLAGTRRSERQTAYQILVATKPEVLAQDQGDLWDSGRVASDHTIQVPYAGKPLTSAQPCHWKVRVWDGDGTPSPWSTPATWSMGLLAPGDWQARWIGLDDAYLPSAETEADNRRYNLAGLPWIRLPQAGDPAKEQGKEPGKANAKPATGTLHLRREFTLPTDRPMVRAVLCLYAYNTCTAMANGTPLGEAAHWEATARLDATAALRPGTNCLALTARHLDGYPPGAIGRLVVQFASGPDLTLPVDATWKASPTAEAGWERPGFADAAWATPLAQTKTPFGTPSVADQLRPAPPYLRKEFRVPQPVVRATLYVTALGLFEARLNGQRVGDDVFAPGWQEYLKRVHYRTYDVTRLVKTGDNALAAILGDGWYAGSMSYTGKRNFYGGRPRFLAQLALTLADGSTQVVASDASWKGAYGPLRYADLYQGCTYDARLAMPGWDAPGFADGAWKPVVDDGPALDRKIVLQAANVDGSRALEELPAKQVSEPSPGCWTFDLGQNLVGWVRLKVRGARPGTQLTIRHAEMVNADGTLYTAALRGAGATDRYICAGGDEVFEPTFTFHGFRYVEVRGLESPPGLDAVTGIVAHTPMTRSGSFASSHGLLNQLYANIIWGQKGNYLEVPTDCPQRDERLGWTGDTQFFMPTAIFNYDVAAFITRWLQTSGDSQFADGSFPHVIPNVAQAGGSTAWGDAPILCTHALYRAYGDVRLVEDRFPSLDRYMAWLAKKTVNGISTVGGFGDWLNAGGGAPKEVMDTAYHAHLARLMAEMAQAIGRHEDAARYAQRHAEVKAAFIREFLQPDGSLKGCSQTGYALAFTMDLLPEDRQAQAATHFVAEIARFNHHLATGFIGTPRLLPGLAMAGRDDVACRLLLTDTYPSWLFPVKNGATTMWERWNGWTPEKGFGDVGMNSFNHYAFGAVGEYLYAGLGGIQATSPGYRTLSIRPVLAEGLDWVAVGYDSCQGPIRSAWRRDQGKLRFDITIPANTTAVIALPVQDPARLRESGTPTNEAPGLQTLPGQDGRTRFAAGSGTYVFTTD